MKYQTPKLDSAKLYETPLLLDVQEVTGEALDVCLTSGGCKEEKEEVQEA